jgi:hypothetical protein
MPCKDEGRDQCDLYKSRNAKDCQQSTRSQKEGIEKVCPQNFVRAFCILVGLYFVKVTKSYFCAFF